MFDFPFHFLRWDFRKAMVASISVRHASSSAMVLLISNRACRALSRGSTAGFWFRSVLA
jgi:hypothetical protein